jgi:hypothetical protein
MHKLIVLGSQSLLSAGNIAKTVATHGQAHFALTQ